jgi:hypothetical protein
MSHWNLFLNTDSIGWLHLIVTLLPHFFLTRIPRLSLSRSLSCDGHELVHLCMLMFRHFDFEGVLGTNEAELRNFVTQASMQYQDNRYHCWSHAVDVTTTAFALLVDFGLLSLFQPLDICALLIACLCHDIGHPGRNNNFLIATKSPLALMYNDQSVLENHHCATAFRLMYSEGCRITENLEVELQDRMRRSIISCILATDMSRHQVCSSVVARGFWI